MRKIKNKMTIAAVCITSVITGFCMGIMDISQEAEAALLPNPLEPTVVISNEAAAESAEPAAKLHTEADVKMLARLIYTEARGVKSKTEQAAVVWCVLNRLDNPERAMNSIAQVVTAPYQFDYRPWVPVQDEFRALAEDVLERWQREKQGETEVGRVLPKEYQYFEGDGLGNRFTAVWRSNEYWDWRLVSPYVD